MTALRLEAGFWDELAKIAGERLHARMEDAAQKELEEAQRRGGSWTTPRTHDPDDLTSLRLSNAARAKDREAMKAILHEAGPERSKPRSRADYALRRHTVRPLRFPKDHRPGLLRRAVHTVKQRRRMAAAARALQPRKPGLLGKLIPAFS